MLSAKSPSAWLLQVYLWVCPHFRQTRILVLLPLYIGKRQGTQEWDLKYTFCTHLYSNPPLFPISRPEPVPLAPSFNWSYFRYQNKPRFSTLGYTIDLFQLYYGLPSKGFQPRIRHLLLCTSIITSQQKWESHGGDLRTYLDYYFSFQRVQYLFDPLSRFRIDGVVLNNDLGHHFEKPCTSEYQSGRGPFLLEVGILLIKRWFYEH